MSRIVLRAAMDAWVDQADPDTNHGEASALNVKGTAGSNERQALIFFAPPFHEGAVIEAVTLYLYLAEAWAGGPHTITARRLAERWAEHSVDWTHKPAHSNTHLATVIVTGGAAGDEVAIDLSDMLQDVADGADFFGVQLELDTTTLRKIHGAETGVTGKKPRLDVTWHRAPQPPTDLRPGGGHVVGDSTPRVRWSFLNDDGDSAQVSYQVQVSSSGSAGDVYFDTGVIDDPDSYSPLGTLGFAALSNGEHAFWRVRAKGGAGIWSDYSDFEEIVYWPLPTAAFTNPVDGGTVEETTPPFTHTFSATQTESEYWLFEGKDDEDRGYGDDYGAAYGGDGWRQVWHRHRQKDALSTVHPPNKKIRRKDANRYKIRGRFWDNRDRQGTPSARAFVEIEATFTLDETSTSAPVDTLTATSADHYVLAEWTRAAGEPDFWGIRIDGELWEDRLEGDEPFVSGATYRRKLYGLQPLVSHELEIVPIVIDGIVRKHVGSGNPKRTFTFEPSGVWIIDPDNEVGVKLISPSSFNQSIEIGESATVFNPVGRRDAVRISDAVRGYEGPISGKVKGITAVQRVEKFKGAPAQKRFVLLLGHLSVTCQLGHVSGPTPVGEVPGSGDDRLWDVAIEVLQTDDWRFQQRL